VDQPLLPAPPLTAKTAEAVNGIEAIEGTD